MYNEIILWGENGGTEPSCAVRLGLGRQLKTRDLKRVARTQAPVCPLSRTHLKNCHRNCFSAPGWSLNRLLQDLQNGGRLCQSHQVFPLPLQLAVLYPGCCDPGLRGVDSCRQEQLHFRPTNLIQLAAGGGLRLHRCGRHHHSDGLPGLYRCCQ